MTRGKVESARISSKDVAKGQERDVKKSKQLAINSLKRSASQEHGRRRTAEFQQRIREAMLTIDAEVARSKGIYPNNKGRLNLRELARRAEISHISFYGLKHLGLRQEINLWMEKVQTAVRQATDTEDAAQPKVDDWKRLWEELALNWAKREEELRGQQARFEVTERALEQLHQKLAHAQREIEHLKSQNAILTSDRVVPMKSRLVK